MNKRVFDLHLTCILIFYSIKSGENKTIIKQSIEMKNADKPLYIKVYRRFLGCCTVSKFWLGWQDSNLRMQQSKCCVLPLDDTPILNFERKTPPLRLKGFGGVFIKVGWNIGFEPMVSSATNWRFNQLS